MNSKELAQQSVGSIRKRASTVRRQIIFKFRSDNPMEVELNNHLDELFESGDIHRFVRDACMHHFIQIRALNTGVASPQAKGDVHE